MKTKNVLLIILFSISLFKLYAQNNGDYRSASTGLWSNIATWEKYNGASWAPATTAPILADGAVNVISGHTVTMDATMSIDSLFIQSGGTLAINSGVTITVPVNTVAALPATGIRVIGNLNVAGKVLNQGQVGINTGGIINWNSGSEYEHAQNGGSIPLSTWNTGSTCNVTGVTGSAPSNARQNYFNFTWNCGSQSSNVNIGWHSNTISGILKCMATGSARLQLSNNLAGGSASSQLPNLNLPINITVGAIEITSGTLAIQGSSSTNGAANYTLNVLGDFTITGGSFSASAGTSSYITIVNVGGNFSTTSSVVPSYVKGSTYSADLSGYPARVTKTVFNKLGTQIFTNAAAANITSGSIFEVATGATLDLNTSIISNGASRLICNYNSGLIMSGAAGLNTNITSGTQTYSFDPQVNYTFKGNSLQTTGTRFLDALGPNSNCLNLTIENTGSVNADTVKLSTPFYVYGTLAINDGILLPSTTNSLTLDQAASITGGNASSYIANRILVNTNTTNPITIPLGKDGNYRPVTLTPTTTDATTWDAEYYSTGNANTSSVTAPVTIVNAGEYWDIGRTGTANAVIQLPLSGAVPGATAADKIGIVHYKSASWQWEGGSAEPGTTTSGVLSTSTVTSFSPFAIGVLEPATLPINLINFAVSYNGSIAQLQWKTANEINVNKFEIQKSKDGINFLTIGNVTAFNRAQVNNYLFDDNSILEGKIFYRIKTVDFNGDFTYSNIISINTKQNKKIQVYPNPASNFITIAIPKFNSPSTVQLLNNEGKLMQSLIVPINTIQTSININGLNTGIYYIKTIGSENQTISFIKQ
jgi:hypothetical protein